MNTSSLLQGGKKGKNCGEKNRQSTLSRTMESASCSEEGIFFKASCAASFSWKYSHSLRNTQALNKKKHDESTYKQT
jgi:hypothetical protein